MSCKLCGDTGMKTCPCCKGKRRVTGQRWSQDCNACFKTGEVTCDCKITPRVVVQVVAIHGRHQQRVVAEQEVPQGGDWLPAVIAASQQLNDDVSKIITAHEAWWVEQEDDSSGA